MFRYKISFLLISICLLISACAPSAPALTSSPAATLPLPESPTLTPALTAPPQESPTPQGGYPAVSTPQSQPSSVVTFKVVPAETTVQYAVDETFLNENNRLNTAIGKTNQVTGEFLVDLNNPAQIQFGEFTVDISTLTTDSSRRDNAIRGRWLESSRFPLAKFTVSQLIGFPNNPQEGQELTFQMEGNLTVRDTTRPLTWNVKAVKSGNRLTGEATTFLMMKDWGVEPPNIAGVLIVKDGVNLTINFTFEQVP